MYPLAGTTRASHPALTEATDSIIAQRPKKRTRVLNDRELLVALHQKQDRHHDWLKRQMQSLLVDVNRIHNLATKNAFVAHETSRRTWKGLTLMCSEDDLQEDGFSERFKFDSTTPSLEDSEFSSSAATVTARISSSITLTFTVVAEEENSESSRDGVRRSTALRGGVESNLKRSEKPSS